MIDRKTLEEIRSLSGKISRGRQLNEAEMDLYDDIQEDEELRDAFNLWSTLEDCLAPQAKRDRMSRMRRDLMLAREEALCEEETPEELPEAPGSKLLF